ncbi:aminoglycoside phosphotransferase family protein [Shewanella pealeana]|nr:aminoglycoside 3'-phosphotransferase/choline kinase family protein [Shewanella pealeana]
MNLSFLTLYPSALWLPESPEYDLACDIIDHLDFSFWRPLTEKLALEHRLTYTKCTRVTEGANPVFIYEGEQKFVLKLVPPNWSQQAKSELTGLKLLEQVKLALDVPKLICHGHFRNWDYIFMSFVEGENLASLLPTLTQQDKEMIAFQLGEFCHQLHQIPITTITETTTNVILDWPILLQEQRGNIYQKRQQQGLIEPFLSDLEPYLNNINIQCKQGSNHFIHTDLHPANLLVKRTAKGVRLTGVIDFGDAIICPDPVFEFTSPGLLLALSDKKIFTQFLDGYGFDYKDKQSLVEQCMALSLLRHTGELNYILNTVPHANTAKGWKQAERYLFPLCE